MYVELCKHSVFSALTKLEAEFRLQATQLWPALYIARNVSLIET